MEFFSDMFEDRDEKSLRTPVSFDYSGLDTIVLFCLKTFAMGENENWKAAKKIEMNKL